MQYYFFATGCRTDPSLPKFFLGLISSDKNCKFDGNTFSQYPFGFIRSICIRDWNMFSNLKIATRSMLIFASRKLFSWAFEGHTRERISFTRCHTIAHSGPKILQNGEVHIAHRFIRVCLCDKRDSLKSQKDMAIADPSFYLWNICGACFVSLFSYAAFILGAHQSTLACLKA